MKRFLCAGGLLLLSGWCVARPGLRGVAFVYKHGDGDMAYIQPMLVPQIGVQLKRGPREISKGAYLVCKPGTEHFKVISEGQETEVTNMTLTCDDRVFVVKGIVFEQ